MKQLYIRLALIALAFAAVLLFGKFLGGALFLLVKAGVITFAATWLSVFLTTLAGFGPIGTTPKFSARKAFAVVAVISLAASLLLGGLFAAGGALIGVIATLVFFRGAL